MVKFEHGRIYFGSLPADQWSLVDPQAEGVHDQLWSLHHTAYNATGEKVEVDRAALKRILGLAHDYMFFVENELGTENSIKKLRALRAALKVRP